jgi:peptidyl-tRNA hydrolase, PTH1 family
MKLIIGLGNPGKQYLFTRHNVGFMLQDVLAHVYGCSSWQSKFQGLVSTGAIAGHKVVLLKPQTFMNLSGQSVQAAAAFYKIKPEDMLVVHDELDLALGHLKYKKGGSDAGHNGLKSITAALGANYGRLRIGIGRPEHKSEVSSYVLNPFDASQSLIIAERLGTLASHAPELLTDPIKLLAKLGNPA